MKPVSYFVSALKQRTRGIPRSVRELCSSLQYLAVLRALGWHKSLARHAPVNAQGEPIPWYTYPAVAWIQARIRPTHRVFEFGAGHSTVWYARRAASVISVDHVAVWVDRVREMVSGTNARVLCVSTSSNEEDASPTSVYAHAIDAFPPGHFDIIVIDGMERSRCVCTAIPRLKPSGIVIFDNSDRPAHKPGIDCLHANGFRRIDFYGPVAQVGTSNCTSIFWRDDREWNQENHPIAFQGWDRTHNGPEGGWLEAK